MEFLTYYRPATEELPVQIIYFPHSLIPKKPAFTFSRGNALMLLYMYSGKVECGKLGEPQILGAGDVYVALPGELYTFRNESEQSRYVQVIIHLDQMLKAQGQSVLDQFIQPFLSRRRDICNKLYPGIPGYEELAQQLRRLDPMGELVDSCYQATIFSVVINCLMTLFAHSCPAEPKTDPQKEAVACCLEYIEENYAQKITLQELADLVQVRPNQLCRIFRKLTQRTPFDHLIRQRTRTAARFLRSTLMPIPEVGLRCGFPSNSFFIRRFSQVYSMPPLAYRKKYFMKVMKADKGTKIADHA